SVRRPGRPSRVDRAAQARLPGILALGAARSGFPSERWTLARIAKAAEDSWGVRYSRGTIHRILVTQGFRWTRPERRPGRPSKVRPQGKAEPGSAQAWSPGPRVLRLMRSRVRVGRAKGRRPGPNRRIRA
ncbi:MAG TPA: winged helix-turn-helix domain-containing protein, partial [Thermoplasmata archaeon]|nr:winged helix-turn-helix domain-containing protein [Thermoplasmata archaeon]